MKAMKGAIPVAVAAGVLIAAGIVTPTALAEMQHAGITKFTPGDISYGVMRFGEGIMSMYRFNKTAWNGELLRVREMEKQELQNRCPSCSQQIQQLEQEMQQIKERVRTEYGTGEGLQTHTQTEGE